MESNSPAPSGARVVRHAVSRMLSHAVTRTASVVVGVYEKLSQSLLKLGHGFAAYLMQLDARRFWRRLALNWHRVAAVWLMVGVVLAALVTGVSMYARAHHSSLTVYGIDLLAWVAVKGYTLSDFLSGVAMGLSLPLLLPALLLSALVVLALAILLGLFGPVLVFGVVAVGLLFFVATLKLSWMWALRFIRKSIESKDETRDTVTMLARSLGISGGSTVTMQDKPRLLAGDEFERYKTSNRAANRGAPILLGTVADKPWSYWTEKHVLIAASTRSGKGRDLIIPNLKRYSESVFVLDPKGENCTASMVQRLSMGNVLQVFDPYGLTGCASATFNPMAELMGSKYMVRGADYLAEALVIGEDNHWNESARGLIRALVLHMLTCPEEMLRGRKRDLPSLRELLSGSLDLTLSEMAQSDKLNGLIARLAQTVLDLSKNERSGVVSTARRDTKWLDNEELADMFRDGPNSVSFADLRDPAKRVSVFVCLPPEAFGTYPQVCRLLTTFALDTMMRTLTGRKRPTLFILDELAQLKHLAIVERAFTLGAGYGLQVWSVFQSVAQASKLYPLDALYGSAGLRCFFKLEDTESCEYASKAASAVLSPADVRHLPELGMLALLDGTNPLLVERLGPPKA